MTASKQDLAPVVDVPSSGDGTPSTFDALFNTYGEKYRVPPLWLKAFCMNESDLGRDPRVVNGGLSSDGKSKGIMQLTEPTAQQFEGDVTLDDLNDPVISVRIAAQFVRWLMEYFDPSDPRYREWVVKSYNQGPGKTEKEIAGTGGGYADEYWNRWQRNFKKIGGV